MNNCVFLIRLVCIFLRCVKIFLWFFVVMDLLWWKVLMRFIIVWLIVIFVRLWLSFLIFFFLFLFKVGICFIVLCSLFCRDVIWFWVFLCFFLGSFLNVVGLMIFLLCSGVIVSFWGVWSKCRFCCFVLLDILVNVSFWVFWKDFLIDFWWDW